ncbi:MAG: DUF4437 domain-containing protein [Myxococcota bacterium]|nr:DUF4437 domain-containing protein [Myxococcota bacterium]
MLNPISLTFLSFSLGGCGPKATPETAAPEQAAPAPAEAAPAAPTSTTVNASEVAWKPINPEQPDGPMWVILDGDPKTEAFAAMAKVPAGFSPGLHTHGNTMTGLVISGTMVNGRTAEEAVVLSPGSMWSQPGGEARYTGCTEASECVFVLTMDGPVVRSIAEAPAEKSTQIVMAANEIDYVPMNADQPDGPALKMVHGDPSTGPWMAFAKLPAGQEASEAMNTANYTGALISGSFPYGEGDITPGSHWTQAGGPPHMTTCNEGGDCIFFVSMSEALTPPASEDATEEAPAEESAAE